ncbi:MAG: TetR/AcrR family transcriptional regulator [Spirochaetes bacterium]|nr:TetR/AcrR family transcriptional regulator [Spirochaetota bacterium]
MGKVVNIKQKNTLGKLKSEERQNRKNLIIDAAERVFASRPFDKVSMREIAEEAGMAVSSIYTYFPNQESLFLEAVLRDSNQLLDEIEGMIQPGPGGSAIIDRVIETFIEFIAQRDSYYRMMVVFMTHGNLKPESIRKLNGVVGRGLAMFDPIFVSAGYRGNVRLLSHYFFAMLNGILVTFRKFPGRSDKVIVAHMKRVGRTFTGLLAPNNEKKSRNGQRQRTR